MRILPLRCCAIRMAVLICLVGAIDCLVGAIDAAAVALSARPLFSAAIIRGLIPVFTPAAIFTLRAQSKG
jgi:hypothetical protein